jgi:hypothetical protein
MPETIVATIIKNENCHKRDTDMLIAPRNYLKLSLHNNPKE